VVVGFARGTICAAGRIVDEFRTDLRDALLGGTDLGENLQISGGQHIVALRTDVLNDAEHALGNLFQRMYHVTRVARDGLGPYADRMTDTLQHLERLLQLVFDYVSPVEIEMRPIDAARVVESLAAHIRARGAAKIDTPVCSSTAVLADARNLGRSFQLLALAFEHELAAAAGIAIEVAPESRHRVEFLVRVVGSPPAGCEAESVLAWEVAARLIELQGGELARTSGAGGCTCTVVLPTADGGHGTA
jgi:hypothetical protein